MEGKFITRFILSLIAWTIISCAGVGVVTYGVGRANGYKEATVELFGTIEKNNMATTRVTRTCHKMMDVCFDKANDSVNAQKSK